MAYKITSNKVKCKCCNDVIETIHINDCVVCMCGKVKIEGGHDILKRIANRDDYIELSTNVEIK